MLKLEDPAQQRRVPAQNPGCLHPIYIASSWKGGAASAAMEAARLFFLCSRQEAVADPNTWGFSFLSNSYFMPFHLLVFSFFNPDPDNDCNMLDFKHRWDISFITHLMGFGRKKMQSFSPRSCFFFFYNFHPERCLWRLLWLDARKSWAGTMERSHLEIDFGVLFDHHIPWFEELKVEPFRKLHSYFLFQVQCESLKSDECQIWVSRCV